MEVTVVIDPVDELIKARAAVAEPAEAKKESAFAKYVVVEELEANINDRIMKLVVGEKIFLTPFEAKILASRIELIE